MEAKRQCVAAAEDRAFAGDFAGAAALLRGACHEDPGDAELWFLFGYYLARAGDLDGAARALGEAISIEPDHGMAHHVLANCWRDMHRLELATSHYRRALEVLDDEAEAIADFGLCQLRAGDLDLAAALFRRALSLDGRCELAQRGLEAVGEMASVPPHAGETASERSAEAGIRAIMADAAETPSAPPAMYNAAETPSAPPAMYDAAETPSAPPAMYDAAEPPSAPPASPFEVSDIEDNSAVASIENPGVRAIPEAVEPAGPIPQMPRVPPPRQLPRLDRRLRGPAARMAGASAIPHAEAESEHASASAARASGSSAGSEPDICPQDSDVSLPADPDARPNLGPGGGDPPAAEATPRPAIAEIEAEPPPPEGYPGSFANLFLTPDVDWPAVAAEAEKAVTARPDDFEACLRLGGALVRMREFERAVPVLERVMARTEGRGAWSGVHAEALALLAEVLIEKKDSLAAYRVGQTMQRLYPDLPRTLYLTGRISHLCGDPRQALRSLKEAARLDPEGPVGRVAMQAIADIGG